MIEAIRTIPPPSYTPLVSDKRHMLHEYLYEIGEEHRFEEVAADLVKPPEAHYGRTGYSAEQRIWVKTKRDQGLDLAPYTHLTDKERHLHHIFAQAFCQAYLGLSNFPELINHPHNGITLSKIAHVGPYIPNINHSRHPDVFTAKQAYKDNPDLMRMVFEDHWRLALDGVKYWVSSDDHELFTIARQRTDNYKQRLENKKRGNDWVIVEKEGV